MDFFIDALYAVTGLLLVAGARPLSLRYNAWTTALRERHPNINPPPTPEWRVRNTTIMTWLFRAFGGWLVLLAFLHVAPLLDWTTKH
jgi:hypothetical protein